MVWRPNKVSNTIKLNRSNHTEIIPKDNDILQVNLHRDFWILHVDKNMAATVQ